MLSDFVALRQLEDRRIKMRFDDGIEVVARLNSATQDIDGSKHRVYDQVEWASDPHVLANEAGKTLYAKGESLIANRYRESLIRLGASCVELSRPGEAV